MNDEQFLKKLETRAYYAVVRAFAASGKLTFDTEAVLMDLQQALDIDDDTAMELTAQMETDQEVNALKMCDSSAAKMAGGPQQAAQRQPARPVVAAQITYPMESPFGQQQPAAKKQKKGGGGSLPPPTSRSAAASPHMQQPQQQAPKATPGTGAAPGAGAGAAAANKQRPRSLPSTPQVAAGAARGVKAVRPAITTATFMRVMQRNMPDEMEAYLADLNNREREIFTELISLGVDENDPELNEVHRSLLSWYKLDQRQALLSQQLAMVA